MTVPMRVPIDLSKGLTGPVMFAFMVAWDNYSVPAWTYLALHGTYGVMWVLKSWTFPDPNWERPLSPAAAVGVFVALWLYWIAGWLLISSGVQPHPAWIGACVAANALGTFLVFGADAQKYFVLRARKGLITDGFFARTRNPNYLGEMLIYGSFAALSGHLVPWVVCALYWGLVFWPNMRKKDQSMARYPEWEAYAARTGMLLPRLTPARADRRPAPAA